MEEREKLLKEIQGLIADSQKESVKKADLEARVEEFNKKIGELNNKPDNHTEVKALKESVDNLIASQATLEAAIRAINEKPAKKADKPATFKDALIAAVMEKSKDVPGLLTDKNDDNGQRKSLKDYFTEKGNKTTPVFKIAVDMLESNINGNYVNNIRLTELDPQRVGIPLAIYPHVLDWMPSKPISKPFMSLLVVYTYVDGAGTKTEGSASSQSSFLLKTVEFKSFYIATYFTLSDETLDDLEEAMAEIAVTGPDKIQGNVDSQILGAAGDDSSALAGLLTSNKKTDFASGTTYAASIPSANKVDVIATMKLQAEASKYLPDVVVVSPTELNKLGAEKDQMDNSKADRRVVFSAIGEPTYICGLRVIKSTDLASPKVVVCDSKQLMIGRRKEMTLEIGYNGNDLTEGQKTAVVKIRVAFGVRDKAAVIYASDIDAAQAAIAS